MGREGHPPSYFFRGRRRLWKKVKVVSTVKSRMGVKVPEMRFSRQWLKKGSAVMIDRDILEELMYDSGF